MPTLICKTVFRNGKVIAILNQGNTRYISTPKTFENLIKLSKERRQHLKNQRVIKDTWNAIFNTKGV